MKENCGECYRRWYCYIDPSECNKLTDSVSVTNADRIRSMNDEELAEFLTDINPTNCKDCGFSHGWRCQPDRDDCSDFEKCKEGRKRWLQMPAEEADNEIVGERKDGDD